MEYTPEFELFWSKYPKRWNKDFQGGTWVKRKKRPAFDKWQKLSPAVRAECLYKAKYIKQYEGGAVRDCITWLNQYGWEDIDLEVPAEVPDIVKTIKFGEVPNGVNVNNERNRQINNLERKKKCRQ